MTIESTDLHTRAAALRGLCGGAVHLPGDPGYEDARLPWNLVVDQRPAAVAYPAEVDEVIEVVRAARSAGLRIAAQSTGHNAGPLGSLEDVVLVRTSAMRSVTIDPQRLVARAEGGALWQDAVEAAAEHGLATLHGSSPDVGIAGYSLGGGMGWYARKHGLATNALTAIELVDADGELVRADADQNAELFWALRGGGGNFGVVVALEFRLLPFDSAYGGMLVWDQKDAAKVVHRWAEWSLGAPDEVTTSLRMMNLPPLPELPEPFRGRRLVVIDGAVLESDSRAEEILAPLRELDPEMDTFARVEAASLIRLHMDPEEPTPAVSGSAILGGLPEPAVETFLALTGPESQSSLLFAELRQLGGALGRPAEQGGALPMLDGQFVLFNVAIAATPEMAERGHADATALVDALSPYATGADYLNFAEQPVQVADSYPQSTWRRLQAIKAAADPDGVFVANHPITPEA